MAKIFGTFATNAKPAPFPAKAVEDEPKESKGATMENEKFLRFKEEFEKTQKEERQEALKKLNGFLPDSETEHLFVLAAKRQYLMRLACLGLVLLGIGLACGFENEIGRILGFFVFVGGISAGILSAVLWNAIRCPHCGRRLNAVRVFTNIENDLLWFVCDTCKTCAFSGARRGR